jgi:hypothetical protein
MAPADTTMQGLPVSGDVYFEAISTTNGVRMEEAISPVWPPPSPPYQLDQRESSVEQITATHLADDHINSEVKSFLGMLRVTNDICDDDLPLRVSDGDV